MRLRIPRLRRCPHCCRADPGVGSRAPAVRELCDAARLRDRRSQPSRRKAASAPRWKMWARTTLAGPCTTRSRDPTGSATVVTRRQASEWTRSKTLSALSLSHHHELYKDLPEGPQPGEGHCGNQENDGGASMIPGQQRTSEDLSKNRQHAACSQMTARIRHLSGKGALYDGSTKILEVADIIQLRKRSVLKHRDETTLRNNYLSITVTSILDYDIYPRIGRFVMLRLEDGRQVSEAVMGLNAYLSASGIPRSCVLRHARTCSGHPRNA